MATWVILSMMTSGMHVQVLRPVNACSLFWMMDALWSAGLLHCSGALGANCLDAKPNLTDVSDLPVTKLLAELARIYLDLATLGIQVPSQKLKVSSGPQWNPCLLVLLVLFGHHLTRLQWKPCLLVLFGPHLARLQWKPSKKNSPVEPNQAPMETPNQNMNSPRPSSNVIWQIQDFTWERSNGDLKFEGCGPMESMWSKETIHTERLQWNPHPQNRNPYKIGMIQCGDWFWSRESYPKYKNS